MYHFIGINEPRMTALAMLLNSLGYEVAGSFDAIDTKMASILNDYNIRTYQYDIDNVYAGEIIVKGHIADDNIELKQAEALDIKVYDYIDVVSRFVHMFETVVITGTYGKSLAFDMFRKLIGECNYLTNDGYGYASKDNQYFVLELNQEDVNNLLFTPKYLIITNIDDDAKAIDHTLETYQALANKVTKLAIISGDDVNTNYLEINKPVFKYGLNDNNDIIAKNITYSHKGTSFDLFIEDNFFGHFEAPVYGTAMLLDIMGPLAIAYYERVDLKRVQAATRNEHYLDLLYQEKANTNYLVVDHKNQVIPLKATIKALKQKYPNYKLFLILRPDEKADYAKTLALVRQIYVVDGTMTLKRCSPYDLAKLKRYKRSVFLYSGANIELYKEAYLESLKK